MLKELLFAFNRNAHVISLDSWLRPKDQRDESLGVLGRYDLQTASASILDIVHSKSREVLEEKIYDRVARVAGPQMIEHSIGPEDILIVEGVPALLMEQLNTSSNVTKVYIQIKSEIRSERLRKDYLWRGKFLEEQAAELAKREFDETPLIIRSSSAADFFIDQNT